MSSTIDILSSEKLVYSGVLDFKDFYKHLHDWIDWKKYDIEEKEYKEKVKAGGKELSIVWEASKKVDEYSQLNIKVAWQVIGLTDVEVTQGGQKKKMQNVGEIELRISTWVETDYDDKWESKPLLRFMKEFYENYLYKGSLKRIKDIAWKDGWDLHHEAKAFLNLYKY